MKIKPNYFVDIDTLIQRLAWKKQRPRINIKLLKKNNNGGLILPDI
jgi:hypothetical protein